MKIVKAAPTDRVSAQVNLGRPTDELGAVNLRANVFTVAEGSMPKHVHDELEELYLALDGAAESSEYRLGPREALTVPPGAEHQLANVGRGPLTFFVVAAPNVTGDAERR